MVNRLQLPTYEYTNRHSTTRATHASPSGMHILGISVVTHNRRPAIDRGRAHHSPLHDVGDACVARTAGATRRGKIGA